MQRECTFVAIPRNSAPSLPEQESPVLGCMKPFAFSVGDREAIGIKPQHKKDAQTGRESPRSPPLLNPFRPGRLISRHYYYISKLLPLLTAVDDRRPHNNSYAIQSSGK
ncbi:hypothetical protein AWENTII_005039 [Aspergillus wentii]